MLARNLPAFLLGAQLLGTVAAGVRAPSATAPGRPLLEIDPSVPAALAARMAEAALDAGIAVSIGPLPRGRTEPFGHVFVATRGDLPRVGAADGVVVVAPGAAVRCARPCLLLRGGAPASRQKGVVWELSFPGLEPGRHLSPDEDHALLEAMVLWLRARSRG